MINWIPFFSVILLLFSKLVFSQGQDIITFGTLIDEMTDLKRLTYLPDPSYRMVQFSSYDRRSKTPEMEGWFSNSDGFGNEPIPGFEEVLVGTDQYGIGTYLMCDVREPGAILRRWTAGINGEVRCYLDNMEKPFYEGKASDFFWNVSREFSGLDPDSSLSSLFRQSDANYFPIPFSSRCRIEWTGDISKIHFYHIGFRVYQDETKVKTFIWDDLDEYAAKLRKLRDFFDKPDLTIYTENKNTEELLNELPPYSRVELLNKEGTRAVDNIAIKFNSRIMESVLRQCVLNIYFDDAVIPQVQSPLGDFFGAAPGLNPYFSLPFSVQTDSTLVCRFLMPFQRNARIIIENFSDESFSLSARIHFEDYTWEEGFSMHFHARWKMDHGLTASKSSIMDIPYIMIMGKGRIVGAAAFLYNPSQAVTSWGNWWGEGDEKIFIDNEIFPSFFGTGSEDYFNYSWSSDKIFYFPYCGQPRNDGPGNRGYISNFRWHIIDDLFFQGNISFYMELFHHGIVPDFSYGRIIYSYSIPGSIDDAMPVNVRDIQEVTYQYWSPEAYLGSAGFRFIEAEKIVNMNPFAKIEKGDLYSEGHLLMWRPENQNEKLTFTIDLTEAGDYFLGFTMAHLPGGGLVSASLNGEIIHFNDQDAIDLNEPQRIILKNHISKGLAFKKGSNEVDLQFTGEALGKAVGVDFLWLKEKK